MIASLLRDLGAELGPSNSGTATLARRGEGAFGTFYVFDAATTVDPAGRRTIPATSFVAKHDVRTVFGVGGALAPGSFFAMILFSRQHVTRSVADYLVPLASEFARLTKVAVDRRRLFAPPVQPRS
jgi:hypothetical protein